MDVNITELKNLAAVAAPALKQAAQEMGRDVKMYLHWTAGDYATTYSDYHICIIGNGMIKLMCPLSQLVAATWKRNTGSVAIALCCAEGASPDTLGNNPPTDLQIESMAEVIAALSDAIGIPIDKDHVMTHGEAADNEDGLSTHPAYAWWNDEVGDGDTRGDLEYLGTDESPVYNPYATDGSRGGDVLRGKALWYQNKEEYNE